MNDAYHILAGMPVVGKGRLSSAWQNEQPPRNAHGAASLDILGLLLSQFAARALRAPGPVNDEGVTAVEAARFFECRHWPDRTHTRLSKSDLPSLTNVAHKLTIVSSSIREEIGAAYASCPLLG